MRGFYEGAGDGGALFLAAGKGGGAEVAAFGQTDVGQGRGRTRTGLGGANAHEREREENLLESGEGGEEIEALENEAAVGEAEGVAGPVVEGAKVVAEQRRVAGVGREEAAEGGEKGALAGAGGTGAEREFAGKDFDRQIAQDLDPAGASAVGFAQKVTDDGGGGTHGGTSAGGWRARIG